MRKSFFDNSFFFLNILETLIFNRNNPINIMSVAYVALSYLKILLEEYAKGGISTSIFYVLIMEN